MPDIVKLDSVRPKALEFFAGIGLARIGLERAGFSVSWSNDYEPAKWSMYRDHFGDESDGGHSFVLADVGDINAQDLPRNASLAWGSSPCTDLSLAGSRGGLRAGESNAFWQYIRILDELGSARPPVAVLENVVGLATSHGGDDLAAAVRAFNELGYSVDVLALDARRFIPQSRPRLFLVAVQTPPDDSADLDSELRPDWLQHVFADSTLRTHRAPLPALPSLLLEGFGRLAEKMESSDERWWDEEKTDAFLRSLSPIQSARIATMKTEQGLRHRTAYRRMRQGAPVWEVRPDDISGCLRTARGGSSKQAVVALGDNEIRVRWMTPREYARLMGASEYDVSGARINQALSAFGDAVAVPVVSWLAENYLMPMVRSASGTAGHSPLERVHNAS